MIDLRKESLPNTVCVGGRDFLIKTDFRTWLQFYSVLKKKNKDNLYLQDLIFVFEDQTNLPQQDFSAELYEFFANPNDTPMAGGGSGENILDYIQDGEYIVGSFMQAYGIDLTECNMHWHKFQALLRCLPANTKIVEIMNARGYKKQSKKQETLLEERKNAWKRPTHTEEEKREITKQLEELFYNS